MRPAVYLAILLLLAPVQASLLAPLSRIGLAPDLGMALLYVVAILTGPREGALAGVALGLLQDVATASLFGASGLSRGIAGFGMGLLGQHVLDFRGPLHAPFLAVFTVAEALFTVLFLNMTAGSLPVLALLLRDIVPRALVTALAGYWVLQFAARPAVLARIRRRGLPQEA